MKINKRLKNIDYVERILVKLENKLEEVREYYEYNCTTRSGFGEIELNANRRKYTKRVVPLQAKFERLVVQYNRLCDAEDAKKWE